MNESERIMAEAHAVAVDNLIEKCRVEGVALGREWAEACNEQETVITLAAAFTAVCHHFNMKADDVRAALGWFGEYADFLEEVEAGQ